MEFVLDSRGNTVRQVACPHAPAKPSPAPLYCVALGSSSSSRRHPARPLIRATCLLPQRPPLRHSPPSAAPRAASTGPGGLPPPTPLESRDLSAAPRAPSTGNTSISVRLPRSFLRQRAIAGGGGRREKLRRAAPPAPSTGRARNYRRSSG
jgi:hypothetical protein